MYFDFEDQQSIGGGKRRKQNVIAMRLLIEGTVQGVGFRAWLTNRAQNLKVNGWVRNRSDKSVETVMVGLEDDVAELIKACYQGPPMASVKKVKQFPYPDPEHIEEGFKQLPTA
jgi:acylphosphatase